MEKPDHQDVHRDRRMQVFLTQARGPVRNGNLLRQAVDRALRMTALRNEGMEGKLMDDALVDTLKLVTDGLDELGITYAVTGSVASSLHGEIHSTIDADLILIASPENAAQLSDLLGPRFYAPGDMLADAARNRTMTNVVDNLQGFKVDLSFVGDDPYLRQVLRRRVRRPIGDGQPEFWFVTPEDVILMKLIWRKDSQSSKQWNDALSVVTVHGARLDWRYLFQEARGLNLVEDLTALRDEGGV